MASVKILNGFDGRYFEWAPVGWTPIGEGRLPDGRRLRKRGFEGVFYCSIIFFISGVNSRISQERSWSLISFARNSEAAS